MKTTTRVLTITANPAIDQTLEIAGFATGKVNRVLTSRMDAGGKGVNVASILGDLRVPTVVTGFLGEQNAGIFERHFAAKGLEDRFVRVPGANRVGIKVVNTEDRETTDINFPGLEITEASQKQLMRTVDELVVEGTWCVLSGSLPTGLQPDFYARLIARIHALGGLVLLDSSGEALRQAVAASPDILKPNLAELEELCGERISTQRQALDAATRLRGDREALVVVSMGAEGALFADGKIALLARPSRVHVYSTVGAGDAMVAGILWARIQGLDLEQTARLATAFGAYAVTRCGAGVEIDKVRVLADQVAVETITNESPGKPVAAGQEV
jgi:1-phosphofructokinase